MKKNGIVFQLGHFYTQMEVTQVKPNSVEHIAKRITHVKIIFIILISDIDIKLVGQCIYGYKVNFNSRKPRGFALLGG